MAHAEEKEETVAVSGETGRQVRPRVVVIGGGFGGLYAAKMLRKLPVDVTIVDRRNFHLFQPLLYQVATGGLSPGDIASPIRGIFKKSPNVRVLKCEARDVDVAARTIVTDRGPIAYDWLIVATGSEYHRFGHPEWADRAPALKTIEDALEIRGRLLQAFETAELEADPEERKALLCFVIVGGGPTGVELAGALGELAGKTLKGEFRSISSTQAEILLLEGTDRLLPSYPPALSRKAERSLKKLGVEVLTGTLLSELNGDRLSLRRGSETVHIRSRNVLWAAGVQATAFGARLAERTGAPTDKGKRLFVQPDLSLANHPEIFVIGDLCHFAPPGAEALPGVAPVAMQQGRFAAQAIRAELNGKKRGTFRYWNKGNLAVIGRNAAVADMGSFRFSGFPAWVLWALIHIRYLVEFDNKVIVLFQWFWNYLTRNRGARLITAELEKERGHREDEEK